jgi:multiple sugar transport system permease protein
MALTLPRIRRDPTSASAPPQWRPADLPLYLALFAASAVFALPFAWLLLTSLKPPAEVFDGSLVGSRIETGNYADVFRVAPVGRWMLNTAIISILGVVSVVFSSSLVAYGFSRLQFRGRSQLFALVISTYLLPSAVTLIPTFLIWNELGAVNTIFPLWVPNLFGSAFYIFMLRQFMLTIPRDLTDAARVDGAGYFRIYSGIMLPLVRPALVAVAIFEFEAKWNDFITPLIYINSQDKYTLALGLAGFKEQFKELGSQWALLMAASVIFTIPMIALFFLFQRYFMEGVAHSGIKG